LQKIAQKLPYIYSNATSFSGPLQTAYYALHKTWTPLGKLPVLLTFFFFVKSINRSKHICIAPCVANESGAHVKKNS